MPHRLRLLSMYNKQVMLYDATAGVGAVSQPARLASSRQGSEVGARASATGIKELNLQANEGVGTGSGMRPARSQGQIVRLQGIDLRSPVPAHQAQRQGSRPLPLQQQQKQLQQAQVQVQVQVQQQRLQRPTALQVQQQEQKQQQPKHKKKLVPSSQLLASPRRMAGDAGYVAEQGALEEEGYASVEAFNVIHAQAMAVKRSNRFV